jgi:hypothetical protein
VAFNAYNDRRPQWNNIGTMMVDGATGKAEVRWKPGDKDGRCPDYLEGSPFSVAWCKEGGIVLTLAGLFPGPGFRAWRVEGSGAHAMPWADQLPNPQAGFYHRCSIASDGERYLVTRDQIVSKGGALPVLGVQARILPADWKGGKDDPLKDGFFPVAGDGKQSCLMGQAAAGPQGTFLVTYTEARGVDDVKVVARTVK